MDGRFRERDIVIDGKADDWKDSLVLVKDADLAVGIANDEQDLYLCVESRNRAINLQALNLGLTVWFDRKAGKEERFGVEYPLGSATRRPGPRGSASSPPDRSDESLSRLAIRGPTQDGRREMALQEAVGVEAKVVATRDDALVYELKVPLQRSDQHPYAIGADPGQVIEIRLETPEAPPLLAERQAGGPPRGGSRGGRGGAGMGGGGTGGGGMGGGMGGRRRGGMSGGGGDGARGRSPGGGSTDQEKPKVPKPLQVSVQVRLAPAPPITPP